MKLVKLETFEELNNKLCISQIGPLLMCQGSYYKTFHLSFGFFVPKIGQPSGQKTFPAFFFYKSIISSLSASQL